MYQLDDRLDDRRFRLALGVIYVLIAFFFVACGDDDGGSQCTDNDGDGYGPGCGAGPDCDDTDPAVNPGAAEACNQLDDNCDDQVDEGDVCMGACTDEDGDGFVVGCPQADDCDDTNRAVFPGAPELCNQADDDCDSQVDEDDVCGAGCADSDGDSYGDGCVAGPDCNDGDAAINPAARETCNQIDDNCDDQTDEGDVCSVTCTDDDGDGFGAGCAAGPDCDDGDPNIHPGAEELCDQVDNDCDDQTDEDGICGDCVDADGDGHFLADAACVAGDDCDDQDPDVSPSEPELPGNQTDDNCNGDIDETVSSPFAGDVVVNEILLDGATDQDANGDGDISSTDDEFVELVNVSADPIDLSGWTLWDSDQPTARHTFPMGTTLPASLCVVVFGGGTAPDDIAGAQFQTAINNDPGLSFGLGLNNTGDVLSLNDETGRQVVVFGYGDEGIVDAVQDQSITRSPDVTGDFTSHIDASGAPDVIFSPGTRVDGSTF